MRRMKTSQSLLQTRAVYFAIGFVAFFPSPPFIACILCCVRCAASDTCHSCDFCFCCEFIDLQLFFSLLFLLLFANLRLKQIGLAQIKKARTTTKKAEVELFHLRSKYINREGGRERDIYLQQTEALAALLLLLLLTRLSRALRQRLILLATAALLFQSINKQTIEKTVVNCFRASTSATAASRRQL